MGEIFDELFIFFLIKKTTNQFLVSFNKNQKKKSKKCCDKKRKKIHTLFCCSLTFSPPYPPNDYLTPSPRQYNKLAPPSLFSWKMFVSKEKGKNDGDKELLYYPARKLHKKTIQKSQKNNQILKKTNISIFSALSLCIPLYYARVRQVLSFIKTKQVQENRK